MNELATNELFEIVGELFIEIKMLRRQNQLLANQLTQISKVNENSDPDKEVTANKKEIENVE